MDSSSLNNLSLDDRVGRLRENAAHVVLSSGNSHVAVLSPSSTPGVFDEEVLLVCLLTVAHSEDSVVELGSAAGVVEDAALVEPEDRKVGSDGNRDWAQVNGSFELLDTVWEYVVVGLDFDLPLE